MRNETIQQIRYYCRSTHNLLEIIYTYHSKLMYLCYMRTKGNVYVMYEEGVKRNRIKKEKSSSTYVKRPLKNKQNKDHNDKW